MATDLLYDIRRGFFNALKPLAYFAQRNQYHVGILMIDIDNFKAKSPGKNQVIHKKNEK